MKRSLLLPALLLFPAAACTVDHRIGENQQSQDAITCDAVLCYGTTVCVGSECVEPSGTCGGIAGLQCPTGEQCVDNPRDNCDPTNGGADCGGVCVATPTTGGHDAGTDAGTSQPDAGNPPMSCGGHRPNPPMCPSGYKCVDDPNTCSMAVDCPGICVVDPDRIVICGGFTPNPISCGAGEICIDNPTTASMALDAPGICVRKVFCGGIAGVQCPGAYTCVDDPSDSCNPNQGGADCSGMCVIPHGTSQCGGIAGIQCPTGLRCLDNPADSCDPANGGADCGGLCVP